MLEDVAAKFNLRIQTVISRIEDLLSSGVLTGEERNIFNLS